MTDEAAISVRASLYSGSEGAIPPSGAPEVEKKLEFPLEKIPSDWYDPNDPSWSPGEWDWPTVSQYVETEKKPIIINIETTGSKPWESRISDIAILQPTDPSVPVIHFIDEDEFKLMEAFAEWFTAYAPNEIIGYNVSFDVRFIFAVAMRYRIKLPTLISVELTDLMQIMKQIFPKYVFGYNPSGSLDDWALYLFGEEPPMTQAEELKAWQTGDYEKVQEFNEWKVKMSFLLLSLIEYTFA